MICKGFILLLVALIISGCVATKKAITPMQAAQLNQESLQFYGICYGPFSGIENPAVGPFPTEEAMRQDLTQLRKYTQRIRVYSALPPCDKAAEIATELGFEVELGCWLSKDSVLNEREFKAVITLAQKLKPHSVVIGNEAILRNDLSAKDLIGYLSKADQLLGVPVTTAEHWTIWNKYPELAKASDYIMVHIYGYWDDQLANTAIDYVAMRYNELVQKYPERIVVIGETGWPLGGPTKGRAVPSLENQKVFLADLLKWANANSVRYFWFEGFSEDWKVTQESGVGDKWNLYFLQRQKRNDPPKVSNFPFNVYSDFLEDVNFIPSGHMGDIHTIVLDPRCDQGQKFGKNCTKVKFDFTLSDQWAGIYWQYPENNWGDLPGYQLIGVKKLTFWAKGKNGGEKVEFKVGGIGSSDKKFRDSLPLQTTGLVELTSEWKQYEIPINSSNLESVISGFCCVTNWYNNRSSCEFYLDNIQYE